MSPATILLVDDSEVTRALLARSLARAGFQVLEARDGAEGAVLALRERPAAVVTDLEMPIMDGYQLARLLKSDPATVHLPVLILTSHDEASSRFWGLKTGAEAYLTKDHKPGELVAAITDLLARAPAPSVEAALPAAGPLEVLARVARHLDASLLESTLAATVLERGMRAGDLSETIQALLGTVNEVLGSRLLGLALVEESAAAVHLLKACPATETDLERCAAAVLGRVGGRSLPAVLHVHGEPEGEPQGGEEEPSFVDLPLRGAQGALGYLPRGRGAESLQSHALLERLAGHLALLLDNARLAEKLQELSTTDGLTRVMNHRAILERLRQETERARRYHHSLSVVLCDLDHFKLVNDTHGHQAGDAVLRGTAQVFKEALRSADALGRYGGEEFLVLLPAVDLSSGVRAAERLRGKLAAAPILLPEGSRQLAVTASFGVAAVSELAQDQGHDTLVALADERLYRAKAAGRNCVKP